MLSCGHIVYCFFCLLVCTVTDFSAKDQRRQILHGGSSASKAGNLPFWETLLSRKPKIGRIGLDELLESPTVGEHISPVKGFIPVWDLGPHLIDGSVDPCESALKRHLSRFCRFCIAHPRVRHTDTQTTLRATSVAVGRMYAMFA